MRMVPCLKNLLLLGTNVWEVIIRKYGIIGRDVSLEVDSEDYSVYLIQCLLYQDESIQLPFKYHVCPSVAVISVMMTPWTHPNL